MEEEREEVEGASGEEADLSAGLRRLLLHGPRLLVEQHWRAWYEILVDWEQRNEYSVNSVDGTLLALVVEQARGLGMAIARLFLGSHRPFEVSVLEPGTQDVILELRRAFFFLFSELHVETPAGRSLGRVRRRFGLLYKIYDLEDGDGTFARVMGPLWRPWTFRVVDAEGGEVATITKKWSGLGREYFTDADRFLVDLGRDVDWSLAQRAVIFAAAISIDFDFFENNRSA